MALKTLLACNLISHYWGRRAAEFIKSKLDDKRAYEERLRGAFEGS